MESNAYSARAAADHFAAKLACETDPADVAAARVSGEKIQLVDVRDDASWRQGHIIGAVHIPARELQNRHEELDRDVPVVVYCWGPGCNASTKAALVLANLGYNVKEMIGGFEYWVREGLQYEGADGRKRRPADDLAAPIN